MKDSELIPEEGQTEAPADSAAAPALPVEPADSAVERLEGLLRDAEDKRLRLAAEYDNFRKRVAKERIELTDRAQAALVTKLLEVIDDLDRLVTLDLARTAADSIHEALVLVDRKLRKELAAAGLERIDPVGQPFNPAEHEAVSVLPPPEPAKDHTVSATFQAGFKYKGNLVRPARVQVYSGEGHA
ncbi:MAG TPA: nucleotide exchange factor GrpE [Gemmatimonadales bacterium]|nr:nucleotide exchange factor GrpE [Gemmatimonadales bacterium]